MTDTVKPDAALLVVRGLSKTFSVREGLGTKKLRAVSDVSLELGRGEVVALVGESGSGKSTIARMVARLVPPTSGKIHFDGRDTLATRRMNLAFRTRVQMIFQDPFGSLNPVHSIGYHLERPLIRHSRARGKSEVQQKVGDLLETVGLNPAAEFVVKYPHQLSGGQRQRVAIARALAVDPELILADEPTSMLDVSIRIDILNLLSDLKKTRGIAYLYITHDLASARYFADRTVVLYAGYIVEGARSGELMDNPAHPYTRLLLSAVPRPGGVITSELVGKSGAPKLFDPPTGCPFADRCNEVLDRCRIELPELKETERGRTVRCHLYR